MQKILMTDISDYCVYNALYHSSVDLEIVPKQTISDLTT